MNKYLFTDGINGVKEVQSQEELQTHAESVPCPDKIRIWVYDSHEWISYGAFRKKYPVISRKEMAVASVSTAGIPLRAGRGKQWLKKFLFVSGAMAGVFLIFNFTKIKWTKAAPVNISAARPVNVPVMDIDSLIMTIEDDRGVFLDRSTRTNLRLRNTWPERIELRLNAERETNNAASRFFNIDISIDNTTGFNLDEAIVKLSVWKNGRTSNTDTLRFNNIRYDKLTARQLSDTYRGDSIAV
ncbi:MAG TPA: hypothetical protein VIV35_11060, partial [Chitinophagaceae bacterium]